MPVGADTLVQPPAPRVKKLAFSSGEAPGPVAVPGST